MLTALKLVSCLSLTFGASVDTCVVAQSSQANVFVIYVVEVCVEILEFEFKVNVVLSGL